MRVQDLTAYEILSEKRIDDLNSYSFLLKHKKSGAKIVILSNDDENKVFSIGFRTPPEDSTGLPHILEHSVLCGSKNFPAKDPFVELVKGSLNTFLNAMTYPDKTIYPVASCNDKDFQNLMHVYLDAVFFTNIYDKEEIFRQEGWNYELESAEDKLKINGVVYNEMKGAFSSPDDVLNRVIMNSLFPDNCYAHESGGDPECIPDLKYSQFLDFHSRYYQPANSYIYLYGDMDVAEKLEWMDQEYLSRYTATPVDSAIQLQKPFAKPIEVTKSYPISSNESEADNTYLSYNAVIGTALDKELYLAFEILDYALLSAPGAPLKQALLDARIGKDIMGSYDNGILQPMFSIIAKNANVEDKDRFLEVIRKTLEDIVAGGMDKKALQAGINYFEFRYREADYGNYPKGLMYGLQLMDSWLYDDSEPFMHIEALDTFEAMKKYVDSDYFESLIQKYLLDNNHASVVIVKPEAGLNAKIEQELDEKLQKYKASLSEAEIEALVEKTRKLRKFQEEPSTQEELEAIPVLQREDIKKEAAPLQIREQQWGDTKVLHHEMYTSGIGYLKLLFDLKQVPEDMLPYAGVLKAVLGVIDTENYKYGELFNEININTGGIGTSLEVFGNTRNTDAYEAYFEVRVKTLYDKLPFAFDMIEEILFCSKLDDKKRLYEIIAQLKSRLQMGMNSAGHSTAAVRSMSYFSPTAYFRDLTDGVEFYALVNDLEQNFEEKYEELIAKLKTLMIYIFRPENLLVSYTADAEGFAYLSKEVEALKQRLHNDEVTKAVSSFQYEQKNEGLMTSAKVQYVARSGNFIKEGYMYTGALRILKVILSYDYLWQNVRVKGGAYGCMSNFNRFGDGHLVSYRDPNLTETNEVFEGTKAYVEQFEVAERDMTKYIIGTISDLDTPLNPAAKGERSLTAYLSHISMEDIQRERDQILSAGQQDIRALGPIVGAVLGDNNFCVLGNENKIQAHKEMFRELKHLF